MWTYTQSIANQNEIELIKIESNIITQWNVKCKTAQTTRNESMVWIYDACCLSLWVNKRVAHTRTGRERGRNDPTNIKIIIIIRKTTHNRITHVKTRRPINVYEQIKIVPQQITATTQTHTHIRTTCINIYRNVGNVLQIWRYTCDEFICMRRNCGSHSVAHP